MAMSEVVQLYAGREVVEERFDTSGHSQNQLAAHRSASHGPGVRYSTRQVDEITRASLERVVSAPDSVLPGENEEGFTFAVVNVQRSAVPGGGVAEQEAELSLGLASIGQDSAAGTG